MRGGDGSFQVVWRTDLEVDLKRTQNKTLLWKGINVKIKVLFYYALLLFYVAVYAFTEQMQYLHTPYSKMATARDDLGGVA